MISKDAMHSCNNCGSFLKHPAYKAVDTLRSLSVFVCMECSLVQSLPRLETAPRHPPSTSSGAGWGNIRYGKGFRTDFALSHLRGITSLHSFSKVLDIGSNRGDFLLTLRSVNQTAELWGIEPDTSITDGYRDNESIKLVVGRLPDVSIPRDYFDLIYCSHTLEHLSDPCGALDLIREILVENGLAYLEVPNIEIISSTNMVEEFFIDKHLYHYSSSSFRAAIARARLEVVSFGGDSENLWAVVRKGGDFLGNGDTLIDPDPLGQVTLINQYEKTLERNRELMVRASARIGELAEKEIIVVWGAGRILDALVSFGGLDLGSVAGVIDKTLSKHISSIHGIPILSPESGGSINPDRLIITSREYFDEIKLEAKIVWPSLRQIYSIFYFLGDNN